MKKFLVVLVVLAITGFAAMAFAADVTVGGSIQIRSRDFNDLTLDKDLPAGAPAAATKTTPYNSNSVDGSQRDTQERIQIDVNAKTDNVKGKISIWNDFDDWGRFEQVQGNTGFGNSIASTGGHFGIREAWLNFNLPGIPVNVTGGHQLLQLGNGWFFRSKHFGSDAWVVANVTGNNTAAFVDVKISEGLGGGTPTVPSSANVAMADDVDAYVLLDVYKLGDAGTVGIDVTKALDRRNALGFAANPPAGVNPKTDAYNIGLNYNGKLGPLALKAEIDLQTGKVENANLQTGSGDAKLKGNEIVLEGALKASDAVTVNILLARGTGQKQNDNDYHQYVNFLDIDPHYTFLYEYKIPTAAGAVHTGFANTTAVSVGAMFAASKSLSVGGDLYWLKATEDTNVTLTGATKGATDSSIGTELDLKLNWQLYDNLSWNWVAGYFKPGDAYKDANGKGTDAATGIQGILAFTF